MANEEHKHLGCRGINAFQSSGLLGYRYADVSAMPVTYSTARSAHKFVH